ncbi:hypothetical protein SAMN04488515_1181 [Cognatiyoonia koreensis]|uniref:Lipoprotein n=1 Tax=Cognatiyoonia koreensis TaxID=364200 RepID=A0A1I0PDZ5_9RHOB|nr:hypothetical protein [Cognatiyoonia koreensis]SEW12642.1 hypothetical protein SAMN04488515_1181 [Cognatiyoonia koreensis]
MRPTLPLLLCATLAISGCSRIAESRFNPFNWFGAATVAAPVDANGNLRPLVTANALNRVVDGRVPVDTVTSLRIDRSPNGGIVTASGAVPVGAFNAQLVPVAQDGGTLTLSFRVEIPASASGTQTITAARAFNNAELAGIQRIVVQAARNSASSTR